MDDDLTPNDSEALGVYEPEEPEEVTESDRSEVNKVAIAAMVADDIISWFESCLKDYESIDGVNKTMNTYKNVKNLTLESAFAAHHILGAEINNLITNFKDRYTKPEEPSDE